MLPIFHVTFTISQENPTTSAKNRTLLVLTCLTLGFQPISLLFHPFSLVLRHFQVFYGKPMGAERWERKWNDPKKIYMYNLQPNFIRKFRYIQDFSIYKISIKHGVGSIYIFMIIFSSSCVYPPWRLCPHCMDSVQLRPAHAEERGNDREWGSFIYMSRWYGSNGHIHHRCGKTIYIYIYHA